MSLRSRRSLIRVGAAAAALVLFTAGCRTSGMAFEQSDELEVLAPSDAAVVRLPLKVRWRAVANVETAEPMTGKGHYYALFLGKSPVAPGESMLEAAIDETCRDQGFACVTPDFLAQNYVYVTDKTSVKLIGVPSGFNTRHKENVNHHLYVVLIGPDNRRVGEAVGVASFHVDGGVITDASA